MKEYNVQFYALKVSNLPENLKLSVILFNPWSKLICFDYVPCANRDASYYKYEIIIFTFIPNNTNVNRNIVFSFVALPI